MAPIIGIIASANWASANASSFDSIATFTGNGSATSFTFSNIPQTYKSLQLRGVALVDSGTFSRNFQITVNGVTSGYALHLLRGNGTTASATGATSQPAIDLSFSGGQFNRTYGQAFIIDIIDYASTSKNKTVRAFTGLNTAGTDVDSIALVSGLYPSTTAITSLTVQMNSATAFKNGQTIALYGVK